MNLKSILLSDDVVQSINDNMDYLLKIIPELKFMIGFDHKNPEHHLDVWEHTLLALSMSEKRFDIRLCLLLHDIGKPFSYQDGKVRHFRNHPSVSSDMSIKILKRLGYDNTFCSYIGYLISRHDSPINDTLINSNKELCITLYKIQKCDALAHNPDRLEKRKMYLNEIEKKLVLKK